MRRYVRIRSITLRCNNVFARLESFLSFLGAFSFMDAQAAIDMSTHLQLTIRDTDLLRRTEPHLLYERLITEEVKDNPHT